MKDREVRLSDVEPNPDQPRRHFDEQALDELASSIAQHGLLQPLVVRPHGAGFQIIAGERRWRAMNRITPRPEWIPVRVIEDLSDEEAFVLATLENVNRRDLRPVEEARAYQRLVNLGKSVGQIAQLFGKTTMLVSQRLSLLALDEPIQALVDSGQLSTGVGWYASRLSIEGQYAVIRQAGAGLSDTELSRFAGALFERENQPEMFEQTEVDQFAAERKRQRRTRVERWWSMLEEMGGKLGTIDDLGDLDLAEALGADAPRFVERLLLLERQLERTRRRFDKAAAYVRAAA